MFQDNAHRQELSHLTDEQYRVSQEGGTEPAFDNDYWDNEQPGLYVDLVTGEPLFASTDKYDSGTGWPSFTKPISRDAVRVAFDNSHGMVRQEVLSESSGSHLGHLFGDGPTEAGGERYCMNSASLKFIAADNLDAYGLQEYASLFEE
ncbi:peptide-methionine (R)-S-oxide reductase MsrB [Demequina sediminicola]|uniref:peptide-methionine (R)-S-oxide reductase MsrB n=1 Tax=Demequina sediminicola TaxID=1095026 RepID=UPI00078646F3|nr:peptide-methionine (R)-S-oxide reductase MsrB [Demequina sediminicola]